MVPRPRARATAAFTHIGMKLVTPLMLAAVLVAVAVPGVRRGVEQVGSGKERRRRAARTAVNREGALVRHALGGKRHAGPEEDVDLGELR